MSITKIKDRQLDLDLDNLNFVKKTGDTMSGPLTMSCTNPGTNPIKFLLDNAAGSATGEFHCDLTGFYDNKGVGGVRFDRNISVQRNTADLYVRDANNEIYRIQIGVSDTGSVYTVCPSSSVNNSIVTTTGLSKTTDGYVKFGNGIILQWGDVSHNYDARATVNLEYPFSNTNYKVFLTNYKADASTNEISLTYTVYEKTSTYFSFYAARVENKGSNPQTANYFAIGY